MDADSASPVSERRPESAPGGRVFFAQFDAIRQLGPGDTLAACRGRPLPAGGLAVGSCLKEGVSRRGSVRDAPLTSSRPAGSNRE